MLKNERRKHPRIETDVTVEVYTSNIHTTAPEVAEICSVVDLSESGMRFIAAEKLKTDQLLRLTFLLPDSIIIIRTDAKLIHSYKKKNNYIEFGVEFANISSAEQKLIRHLVDKKLHPEMT